ncbi:MAG: hypothetical protein ACOYT4_00250 [Nanoarchaeota archaeon]
MKKLKSISGLTVIFLALASNVFANKLDDLADYVINNNTPKIEGFNLVYRIQKNQKSSALNYEIDRCVEVLDRPPRLWR